MATLIRLNFPILSSTQTWVKDHLDLVPSAGWLIVTADQQTAGMGTQGKLWHSPPGNIYATLAAKLPLVFSVREIARRNQLAQITSLAIAKMLEKFGFTPRLKWINDVLLNGKKIAGVLAELVSDAQRELCLLIGVGINVNMQHNEIADYAEIITSLRMEKNCIFDLQIIFESFLEYFCQNMDEYLACKNTEDLTQQIQKRLTANCGEIVTLVVDGAKICGMFLGLDPEGQVRLQLENHVAIFNHGSMVF